MKMRIISKEFDSIDVTTYEDLPHQKFLYIRGTITCILQKKPYWMKVTVQLVGINPETKDQIIMKKIKQKINHILN